jgi:tyrosine phenol-lyase
MSSKFTHTAEPYKIKMVEPLHMTTRTQRIEAIERADYNTFLLKSEEVYIDLLTDSGTSAMSDYQWAGMMLGDEAYAGSKNFYYLEDNVRRYYGYQFVLPTHQGRGAEHILSRLLIKPGDIVPGNMYFTTTRAHQELAGATFIDVIIDEAHDPTSVDPFKGDISLEKLAAVIEEYGAERIPYINVQACVNMAGGQPISLSNLKSVYKLCNRHGIKVILDATRAMENAWFIREFEPGQRHKTCARILKEMCTLSHGCTMSGKKDLLVNIGGFLALRDKKLYDKACEWATLFEGLHTYGGMSGRDMEAMARGIEEAVRDEHMDARIRQVHYLGQRIAEYGVPVVRPFGGHAIYLDAARFLPEVPQIHFPAQALAAALYIESGVRAMERGIVSAGRNRQTGDHNYPRLELVRLTIPRRVYTQSHMDVVAEAVAVCYENRSRIHGLQMTYESESLRFFTARFRPWPAPREKAPAVVPTPDLAPARNRTARPCG